MMTTHIERNSKLRALAAVLLLGIARAHAQENPQAAAGPRIVISVPDRKLALLETGRAPKIYDIAVGKPSTPSPTGSFRVVTRLTDPTWYGPGKVVAPSASNPLGSRWMGLDRKGYGIHGTNAPRSIGRAASHGCIRMRKADLERVFEMVRVGDVVEIHGERDEEVERLFVAPAPALIAAAAGPKAGE